MDHSENGPSFRSQHTKQDLDGSLLDSAFATVRQSGHTDTLSVIMRLTSFTLRKAGFALYGEQWRSELARALGVTDRTIRRWADDEYSIPDDAKERITKLCQARVRMLNAVMHRLEK